jgi:hypothetical protein
MSRVISITCEKYCSTTMNGGKKKFHGSLGGMCKAYIYEIA